MRKQTLLKSWLLLFALIAGSMSVWAEDTPITFNLSGTNGVAVESVSSGDVTITFAKGTNTSNAPTWYDNGSALRFYSGNTITFASSGAKITKVVLTNTQSQLVGGDSGANFPSGGSYSVSNNVETWTASTALQSFTVNITNKPRLTKIEVYLEEGTPKTPIATIGDISLSEIEVGEGSIPLAGLLTYITFAEGKTVTDCVPTITSDDTSVLEISISGTNLAYNAKKAGQAKLTLTLTPTDTENYSAVSKQLTVTVVDPNAEEEVWELTDLADLTENDVFVIVGDNGSNYAMSNNNGTTSAPSVVSVTVSDGKITSTVADNIKWNIIGDATDGYTFYPDGSTTTWLYCTNSNNGVRVGDNANNTFKIQSGYLYHSGTSRYVGIYDSQDWRCYTSINTNIEGQTFAFYKKVTGDVTVPSITASNVEIAYDATEGAISYTINNPAEDGELTAEVTEGRWLTLGTVGETVPFTATANDGAERTATVTLTYTYNSTETVTKTVTVTQEGNPSLIMTIAQVRAQGTGSVKTKGVVTSCVGTTGYIQDATAAICVYGKALTVGDEITVEGTLTTYNGLLEITSPEFEVHSSGNTVTPEVMTIAEINASTNQGWLVKIEDATVTAIDGQNTTIAQGQNTIVVRGISGVEYVVGDVLTLTGNIGCYNTTQIANPTNVTVTAGVALEAVSDKMWTFEDWENGDITTTTIIDNLQVNASSNAKITIDANNKSIDGYNFTKRLKFNGGGTASSRNVHFKVVGNSKITVYGMSGSSSATRKIDINIGNSVVAQLTNDGTAIGKVEYIYSGEEETDVYVYSDNSGNNIYGIKVEPYSSTTPSITVEETEISVGADEADGTIAVTYNNITEVNANVYFCDADGEEADYDWIVAEINDENNIEYLVDANDGAERKAYLKVYALDDDENEVYSELITFTQAAYVAPFEGATYTLATSITPGKHYIIVGKANEDIYAMGGQNNNNRAAVSVTEVNNTIMSVEGVVEFVINEDGSNYVIYDEAASGYLYASSSSSNQLKTEGELDEDDNGKWLIDFDQDGLDDGAVSIVAQGSHSRNVMKYNPSSHIFACYASNNTQNDVYLYEKVEDNTTVTASVSQYKWATFSSEYDLDFTDVTAVEAHIVTGANGSTIVTEKVEGTVAAGTGLLLYSETPVENVEIPVAEEAGVNYSKKNKLVAVTEDNTTIEKDQSGFTNYVLAVQSGKAVFAYIDEVSATLNKGKAYLMLEGDAPAPFLGFDGEGTTGINSVERGALSVEECYTLDGRRVAQPTKGLYIVNGKKVMVK